MSRKLLGSWVSEEWVWRKEGDWSYLNVKGSKAFTLVLYASVITVSDAWSPFHLTDPRYCMFILWKFDVGTFVEFSPHFRMMFLSSVHSFEPARRYGTFASLLSAIGRPLEEEYLFELWLDALVFPLLFPFSSPSFSHQNVSQWWRPPGSPFTLLRRIYVYTAILERLKWGGNGGHHPSTGVDFVHGDTSTNPADPLSENPVFWWLCCLFRCRKTLTLIILDLNSYVQSNSDVRSKVIEQFGVTTVICGHGCLSHEPYR